MNDQNTADDSTHTQSAESADPNTPHDLTDSISAATDPCRAPSGKPAAAQETSSS